MSEEDKILLVGERLPRLQLAESLGRAGYSTESVGSGAEALRLAGRESFALVISWWDLPDLADGALLRRLGARAHAPVLFAAGGAVTPSRRRRIMQEGIEEYFAEPLEPELVTAAVKAALGRREEGGETTLIGESERMREIRAAISQIAPTKVTVLITGESGTGKELVARRIHAESPRADQPFVAVNCGAIPPGLLESELFGHERGAFTGAVGERKGRFELAHQGTLFLDEVGELPLPTQVELLRVLEEESFMRVGGTREVKVDVRVIAATNRDLEVAVAEGAFRHDLYYRLRVVILTLPPLRERPEDISMLADHFLRESSARHQLDTPRLTLDARELLCRLPWPGNVRELRNLMDSMVVLKQGAEIRVSDLPPETTNAASTPNLPLPLNTTREAAERELIYQSLVALRAEISELRNLMLRHLPPMEEVAEERGSPVTPWESVVPEERESNRGIDEAPARLEELEQEAIRRALAHANGNRREAARILGIGLRTLYRKLKLYELN